MKSDDVNSLNVDTRSTNVPVMFSVTDVGAEDMLSLNVNPPIYQKSVGSVDSVALREVIL